MIATRLLSVVLVLATTQVHAADLALKRVMLSSAGVGYFEYAAEVDGAATLGLDVPLAQVDDVLKSLVVFDDSGGIGGIELPGRDQTHSAFGDVPFGPDGLASPLAFLNSLQGVEVTVQGPRPMTGRILQAETVTEPTGTDAAPKTRDRTRVSVLTTDGLKQFVLEDADAVQVTDPDLRARIDRALAALRHESGQDSRHITLRTTGAGHRIVRVSYVAVAPLWKASYRLILPPADADPATATARMQGWATLENASGTDWSGVALSLQYGNPVTFHQAIYRSYFVERPEVPVEVLGRLLPDVDTRAEPSRPADLAAPAPPAPMAFASRGIERMKSAERPALAMAPPSETVTASEGTEETVFPIAAPITLAAGHSASVPILDQRVPAARLTLVRFEPARSLAALRIRNATGNSFPAGVLTLYDTVADAPYAGDARLGGLPVGETRLLSFAEDLRLGVDRRVDDTESLAALTAAKGVLTIDTRNRQLVHVTFTAPASEPRHILLEVPRDDGLTVARDFAQPSEQTSTAFRFSVELQRGERRELVFALDRMSRRSVVIMNDPTTVAAILNLQDASPAARAALSHVAALRSAEALRTAERDRLVRQRQSVEQDEERLRANIATVPNGDALRARLLRQLEADEARIAELATAIDAATQAASGAHDALATAVASLTL